VAIFNTLFPGKEDLGYEGACVTSEVFYIRLYRP